MTLKQRLGKWLIPRLPITQFLFTLLRFEINGFLVDFGNAVIPSRRARLARLRKLDGVRLNVACGPHIAPGLQNLDLFPCSPEIIGCDCRWGLPFGDCSALGIRAEQFVEHLETQEELPAFLKECFRVLKPGGILRVIVPDAGRYLEAYCRGDLSGFRELAVPDPFPADLPTKMDVINHVFHQWHEHRWGYDFETLAHRLNGAGFTEIKQLDYQRSDDPLLAQDRDVHAPYSLYVEARKPR